MENLHGRTASTIVPSDNTSDCAYADLGLWFAHTSCSFHLELPPDQGLVVAVPEMGGPPPHAGRLAALSGKMKQLSMFAMIFQHLLTSRHLLSIVELAAVG